MNLDNHQTDHSNYLVSEYPYATGLLSQEQVEGEEAMNLSDRAHGHGFPPRLMFLALLGGADETYDYYYCEAWY